MSKKKLNASEWLQSLIETILALKEKFKAEYVVDVLRGVDTADTEAYGHTELECFGQGNDMDWWWCRYGAVTQSDYAHVEDIAHPRP